ncbi:MAG: Amidase [Solirubrobacterales bacterium]|nr:Amidase [Solirubrobacterales bacterium]
MRVAELLEAYRSSGLDPSTVAAQVIAAGAVPTPDTGPVWIARVPHAELLAAARALDGGDRELPLYGIPFAVKDNIDVAGMPTTGGLPGAAFVPAVTATLVARLQDAGALLVGKTNMDQLATGLVGTRSPYGACSSVAAPARICGGSSSGSALAVALGQVAFSLGTDTAGSGRVPAAFNGLVGLKPTRGLLSTHGVLPACASLDCVSVFTHDAADAAAVLAVVAAHDPQDPRSRVATPSTAPRRDVVGVPLEGQLSFTEPEAQAAWEAALAQAGARFDLVPVDVSPLLAAAPLLYEVWVAERTTDLLARVDADPEPEGLDPTVASIVRGGAQRTAVDVFAAQHRVVELTREAEVIWAACDALLLPTVPGHPTHAQVAAEPVGVNSDLGRFTNFVNLMDLSAVAVPGPRRADGLPAGVTLLAPAFGDVRLLELAAAFAGQSTEAGRFPQAGTVRLVVVGAHMDGLALNAQLTERGARRVAVTQTAPVYRLYALPRDGPILRPGLIRTFEDGQAIAAEVWELAPAALGELLTLVPAPLALGRVELQSGELVTGFVCEGHAALGATDVTAFGGWRAYLAHLDARGGVPEATVFPVPVPDSRA